MMKYALSLCVLFAFTYVQAEHEWSKEMKEATKECLEKDKMGEDDFYKMIQMGDEKAFAVVACANTKMGLFKNGKFDVEKVNAEAEKQFKNINIKYGSSEKETVGKCIKEVNDSKTNDAVKQLDLFLCFTQFMGKDLS